MFAGIARTVLMCGLTCVLPAQQLRVVSSSEIQDNTLGLQFLDEFNGLFFSAGRLNTTTDAGRTWRRVQISKSYLGADIFGVRFRTSLDGWYVASSGLMRTSDGGQTWKLVRSPLEPPGVAWFPEDDKLGWVGGSDAVPAKEVDGPNWAYGKIGNKLTVIEARLYGTKDGGKTWTKQPLTDGYKVEDIRFVNATHGVARTESGVFYTSDQGQHWARSTLKIPNVQNYRSKIDGYIKADLAILDNAVWVGFCDGHLFKSADRGQSFALVPRNSGPRPCFLRLFFISPTAGWALDLDDGGLVYSTSDGGRSWQRMNWPTARDLFVLDSHHGWLTTPSGLFSFDPSAK